MKQKDNWIPKNGEKVWVKVFSNWSSGTYIGFDNDKGMHLVREPESGGGNLFASSQVLPIESNPNNKNMKQKTAMQIYLDELNRIYNDINLPRDCKDGIRLCIEIAVNQLKSLTTEREQIEEAYRNAQDDIDCVNGAKVIGFSAEFYYQQKYGDEPTIKND